MIDIIDKQKFSCVCLHSDRKPQERLDNLEAFKQKQVKFLICTDVAARGIDIRSLPFSNLFNLFFFNLFHNIVNVVLANSDQHHTAG
jgi:hypothetical protein